MTKLIFLLLCSTCITKSDNVQYQQTSVEKERSASSGSFDIIRSNLIITIHL